MASKQGMRDCRTAYECRDRLPALSAWMSDDLLKLIPLWQGEFEAGATYFDLDNPRRGPFVATGDEARPKDATYVARRETTERAWAALETWGQGATLSQGQAIQDTIDTLGIQHEQSAAGDARPVSSS